MGNSSGSDSPQRTNYSGKGKGVVMGKEKSMKTDFGMKGGSSNHMVGKQYANSQMPGCSGHSTGSEDTKFGLQTGSKNHMFGYTGSSPAKPA